MRRIRYGTYTESLGSSRSPNRPTRYNFKKQIEAVKRAWMGHTQLKAEHLGGIEKGGERAGRERERERKRRESGEE